MRYSYNYTIVTPTESVSTQTASLKWLDNILYIATSRPVKMVASYIILLLVYAKVAIVTWSLQSFIKCQLWSQMAELESLIYETLNFIYTYIYLIYTYVLEIGIEDFSKNIYKLSVVLW